MLGVEFALVTGMARTPRRFTVRAGHSVHKVWRGHNIEWNLKTDEQKLTYLDFYNQDEEDLRYTQGSEIQALTLMSNHTHEVFGISEPPLFSAQMRRHHSRYGAYFNKQSNRCGKVAQDRPHTTLLESSHQEMETVFYVHLNPVRAGIVGDARDYQWSTHKLYAFGKREPWMRNVVLPEWYLKLGRSAELRQRAYRRLLARYLKEKGTTKQRFLKKRFFGSVAWCDKNEQKVSRWRRTQEAPP